VWQYSSTGTVSGISGSGNVDLDQANPGILALLDPGSQRRVDGDPVGVQLQPALSAPGQTLTFTATGLPPGTSMSPAGRITGWLSRSGSYTAQVSVSGTAGATGSVSFSWAVAAAADQGPAGPVRFAVAGRCLNDSGNKSANGTPVDIWTCNGSAAQHWTAGQDRTLRMHGKCLSISGSAKVNGSKLVLGTCGEYASQQWSVGTGAALVNGTAAKCLAGPSTGSNGSRPWLSSCAGKSSQKWTLPPGPVVSEVPGMCADDKSDSTVNGNPVVIWSCDGHAAQDWAAQPDGTVRLAGKCLDIANAGLLSGSLVDLHSCTGSAAQQWRTAADGGGVQLVNPSSGLCLADPDDAAASGTQLAVEACTPSDPGVAWRVR
jgi:beta-glucosidase